MRGGFLYLLALLPLAAAPRSLKLSAAFVQQKAIETFPDPIYVGENDYIATNAQQLRLSASFYEFFHSPFELSYQALHVASGEEYRFGKTYSMRGYLSSFLKAGSSVDTGFIRWHYGFATLITFSNRTYRLPDGSMTNEGAVDTRLSQSYPTGGFTLFPLAPIRFRMSFLDGDANLLYGWLRMQAEYETDGHLLSAAVEILNHASFGKGMPNFVQPPTALQIGYSHQLGAARFGGKLGFVFNPTQGFQNARVGLFERLILEFAISYQFNSI